MNGLEKFLIGALVVIGIGVVVDSSNSGGIIGALATGLSNVFSSLRGKNAVTIPGSDQTGG